MATKRTCGRVALQTPRSVAAAAVALGALLIPAVAQAAPQPSFTVSPSTSVTVGTWVQFDASSSVAAPDATYAWDFGNGDGDSAQEGAAGEDVEEPYDQAGSYTVTLTVSDSTGTASASQTVTVSSGPPTVTFLVDWLYPDELGFMPPPAPGTPVTFQDQSQSNDGSALASFDWSFGDGATGRGDAVTHTYAQAGAYEVTEMVTDSDGLSGQATQRLVIDAPPVASFRSSPSGQAVMFSAIGSHAAPGAGALADYSWSFGEGAEHDSGPDPVVAHTYSFPGRWSVTLDVTDAFGLSATYTMTVDVPANVFVRPLGSTAPLLYAPTTIHEGRAGWDGVLKWSGWNQAHASAKGVGHMWVCTTSCGSGHFVTRPIVVRVSHIRVCAGHREYTRMQQYHTGRPAPGLGPPGPTRDDYYSVVCGNSIYVGSQRYDVPPVAPGTTVPDSLRPRPGVTPRMQARCWNSDAINAQRRHPSTGPSPLGTHRGRGFRTAPVWARRSRGTSTAAALAFVAEPKEAMQATL